MLEIELGLCSCGNGSETPRYILIYCSKENIQREELKRASKDRLNLRKLLDTLEGARVTSRWVLNLGRLL